MSLDAPGIDEWSNAVLDHTGQDRTRYEDALRALGHYLDADGFGNLTVIETPEGFLVKGYRPPAGEAAVGPPAPDSYFFANEDIDGLLEQAYGRRGQVADPRERLRRFARE